MGEERVHELLLALVGQRIRPERRAQQAQAQLGALGVVPVAAVVEQRDPVAGLGQVGEPVAGDLEARLLPGGIAVGRALDDAERGLERRPRGAHRQREARLEQEAPVVPVEAGVEVDPRRARPQPHVLHDRESRKRRVTRIATRCGPSSTTSVVPVMCSPWVA